MSAAENKAVFLSYASQDAEAARRICELLRQAAGARLWSIRRMVTLALLATATAGAAAPRPAPRAEPPVQMPRFVVREKLGLDYLVDERAKLRPIEDR